MNAASQTGDFLAELSRKLHRLADSQLNEAFHIPDPAMMAHLAAELSSHLVSDPAPLAEAQIGFFKDMIALCEQTTRRISGEESSRLIEEDKGDRRFKDLAWRDEPFFDFLRQAYLFSARWTQSLITSLDNIDPNTAQQIAFYIRQYINALSPSNFAWTNPQVLRTTLESKGENLIRGLGNFLDDLDRGQGQLMIRTTDETPFILGKTLALSAGKVIMRTGLAELIHYSPAGEKTRQRPILIVPPWINKYYILDLRPSNSMISWLVEQGLTVFILSWINPDARHAEKDFEDYMKDGPLAAVDAVKQVTGQPCLDIVGYCIGGTLVASYIAWLAAYDPNDKSIASATFLTTLLDFADPGEISVFIDDHQISLVEERMQEKGYLEGQVMSRVFSLLRENDLIWSFHINNYLLGRQPSAFDLLYWNGDSTNMPAAMHSFYLRNLYQKNLLARPGGICLAGQSIDLSAIHIPCYFLATREDHIAPWQSCYKSAQLVSGPVRFVLAASGHIAGVINPPASNKYHHWCYAQSSQLANSNEEWVKDAQQVSGSWWPDWRDWLYQLDNQESVAPQPGKSGLPALADAPGLYVYMKDKGESSINEEDDISHI